MVRGNCWCLPQHKLGEIPVKSSRGFPGPRHNRLHAAAVLVHAPGSLQTRAWEGRSPQADTYPRCLGDTKDRQQGAKQQEGSLGRKPAHYSKNRDLDGHRRLRSLLFKWPPLGEAATSACKVEEPGGRLRQEQSQEGSRGLWGCLSPTLGDPGHLVPHQDAVPAGKSCWGHVFCH